MSFAFDTSNPPKFLFLNSANARYVPHEAMYIWSFDESMQCPPNHSFLISVRDAHIPYSWYQLNRNNNRYFVDEALHTIPEGNYNIIELLDIMREKHPNISFAYMETTNRVTVTSFLPFSMRNDTNFEPFLRHLGFRKDIYDGAARYESDSVVNLSGYNSVLVYSNLTSYNIDSTARRGSNVMAKIPVTTTSNSIIFYTMPPGSIKQMISQHSISEVKLQLLDSLYFPLHLNYIDWSITIQVEVVRVVDEEPPATQQPRKKAK